MTSKGLEYILTYLKIMYIFKIIEWNYFYAAKNNFLGKKNFLNLGNYFLKQENISCLKKKFLKARKFFLCKKFFLM